ncbi:hypothetical protein IE53DRAFT_60848 [Violaceomyces palustris]|uniref:Uncharacterized protein n=1 Tax=Violaceomyces palustris TaxID=1673888 RepID=A0ACD0NZS1_9BASI|nr:hypothetical protein IE53DRAFT_60848 [Violaceomyces palustris]
MRGDSTRQQQTPPSNADRRPPTILSRSQRAKADPPTSESASASILTPFPARKTRSSANLRTWLQSQSPSNSPKVTPPAHSPQVPTPTGTGRDYLSPHGDQVTHRAGNSSSSEKILTNQSARVQSESAKDSSATKSSGSSGKVGVQGERRGSLDESVPAPIDGEPSASFELERPSSSGETVEKIGHGESLSDAAPVEVSDSPLRNQRGKGGKAKEGEEGAAQNENGEGERGTLSTPIAKPKSPGPRLSANGKVLGRPKGSTNKKKSKEVTPSKPSQSTPGSKKRPYTKKGQDRASEQDVSGSFPSASMPLDRTPSGGVRVQAAEAASSPMASQEYAFLDDLLKTYSQRQNEPQDVQYIHSVLTRFSEMQRSSQPPSPSLSSQAPEAGPSNLAGSATSSPSPAARAASPDQATSSSSSSAQPDSPLTPAAKQSSTRKSSRGGMKRKAILEETPTRSLRRKTAIKAAKELEKYKSQSPDVSEGTERGGVVDDDPYEDPAAAAAGEGEGEGYEEESGAEQDQFEDEETPKRPNRGRKKKGAKAGPGTPAKQRDELMDSLSSMQTPRKSYRRKEDTENYSGSSTKFGQGAKKSHRNYTYDELSAFYMPPDLMVVGRKKVADHNEDREVQANDGDKNRLGILWPKDGLARTRLDKDGYHRFRTARASFLLNAFYRPTQEALHDVAWWPGKAWGFKENMSRGKWAKEMRERLKQGGDGDVHGKARDVDVEMGKVGYPFTLPYLDHRCLDFLENRASQDYLRPVAKDDPESFIRIRKPISHPLLIPKSRQNNAVPPATKARRIYAASAGVGDDSGTENNSEEEEVDGGDANESKNQQEMEAVNLEEEKFKRIKNLGFQEKQPELGDRLKIWLGPHDRQEMVELGRGQSLRMSRFFSWSESHVLNAGGHVYSLDWAPVPIHLNVGNEHLAVSCSNDPFPLTTVGQREPSPAKGKIQIWSLSPEREPSREATDPIKSRAKLEMNICVDVGTARRLEWCRVGHDYREEKEVGAEGLVARRLGLLAGVFTDGSLSIFSVPNPEDVRTRLRSEAKAREEKGQTKAKSKAKRMATSSATNSNGGQSVESLDTAGEGGVEEKVIDLHLQPIFRVEMKDTVMQSLNWCGGEMIATGCTNGFVAIWDVGRALRKGLGKVRPSKYFKLNQSAISSVSFLSVPPMDVDGTFLTDSSPNYLLTAGLDGDNIIVDLNDVSSASVALHGRDVRYAVNFFPYLQNFVIEQGDNVVSQLSSRYREFTRSRRSIFSRARFKGLDCSDFHPFIAACGCDGSVKIVNGLRSHRKVDGGRKERYQCNLFKLEVQRSKGELRLLENLLPEDQGGYGSLDAGTNEGERGGPVDSSNPSKGESKVGGRGSNQPLKGKRLQELGTDSNIAEGAGGGGGGKNVWGTNVWDPIISFNDVRWNRNLNRGLLLASGSSCGLVRIDWTDHYNLDKGGDQGHEDEGSNVDGQEEEEEEEEEVVTIV